MAPLHSTSLAGMARLFLLLAPLTATIPSGSAAQELALSTRAPRFLYVSSSHATPVEVDVSRTALLQRTVSLNLERPTVGRLLAAIERQTGVRFGFSRDVLPADRLVTLRAETITVGAALLSILMDTGLDVLLSSNGKVALVEKGAEVMQEGTIVGRVTDRKSGEGLEDAVVRVEGTALAASTGSDGTYRISKVPPDTYTVSARRIGYELLTQQVTVVADQEVTLDLALQSAPTKLDELVVTGTVVPTEVRALPSPISVITETDIKEQRPRTVNQLFRQAVPGALGWDLPNFPSSTTLSVRGTSSFSGGGMKVYLDGIEIAHQNVAAIDPTSIERAEVIRGPQASAIYGSDAIGGVIQLFTKRGGSTQRRPQVQAEAALGAVQTPYGGYSSAVRERYAGSVRGAGQAFSYSFGGSYTRLGDWIPEGTQSHPSVYAGIQLQDGDVTVDLSGRYFQQTINNAFSPLLATTGFSYYSKPLDQNFRFREQTLGARLTWAATSWLRQNVTIGIDRLLQDGEQDSPRLTTPEDTLLFAQDYGFGKTFFAYNSSASGNVASNLSGTITAGLDHYDYRTSIYFALGALNTTGTLANHPAFPISGSRTHVTNTGYFAQVQLGYRSALFLTAGLRGERNSQFGEAAGSPVSPRFGLAYTVTRGSFAIKTRGSWGEAIRPPSPGQSLGQPFSGGLQLANSRLGPERQRGWDSGIEFTFGPRFSLSATYYRQIADDLIQFVPVELGPPQQLQYQNVGRVKNSGIELEAALALGGLQLKGQAAVTNSRIQAVAATYTGDLRVGERSFQSPKYTAGASASVSPLGGMRLTAGLTVVGEFTFYDYVAQFACFGGTGPCQSSSRDYLITYPGFAKLDASLSQQITPSLSASLWVQNVGNSGAIEYQNLVPVMGRITMFGLEVTP